MIGIDILKFVGHKFTNFTFYFYFTRNKMFMFIILKMRQLKQKNHQMLFCTECDENRMYKADYLQMRSHNL